MLVLLVLSCGGAMLLASRPRAKVSLLFFFLFIFIFMSPLCGVTAKEKFRSFLIDRWCSVCGDPADASVWFHFTVIMHNTVLIITPSFLPSCLPCSVLQMYTQKVPTSYVGEAAVSNPALGLDGMYFLWSAPLSTKYTIRIPEWHNVVFQLCTDKELGPIALVEGGVTFRNPYGFIPAELFGFLPFEVQGLSVSLALYDWQYSDAMR